MFTLENTKIKTGKENCSQCKGVGFYIEPIIKVKPSLSLSLCSCVSMQCNTCENKGRPPYIRYDILEKKMTHCPCFNSRSILNKKIQLFEVSNIPEKYIYRQLDHLDDSDVDFMIAHDWANELITKWDEQAFKKRIRGLYLWGGTGSGKTVLACTILNELILRYNVECRYAKINKDFLGALKDTYQKDSEFHGKERSIEMEFANVDVLVIDDFGVQKESEWVHSKLYDLIDSRYEQEKLTLLTSNHSLMEWKEKGEGRIYSRLKEMTKEIHIKCDDYREKLAHNYKN